MVALDGLARPLERADAFDHIRVDGALAEKLAVFERAGLLGKDLDELPADDLALLFGVFDAFERAVEARLGVDHVQVHAELRLEHLLDLAVFAIAEQPVVHEDAVQPVADGLVQEHGHDGRVHAAAEAENDLLAADLRLQLLDGFVDPRRKLPVAGAAADGKEKVVQNLVAVLRVNHFGVELERVQPARLVAHGGVRAGERAGGRLEARGQHLHLVAMAHPDVELGRQPGEEMTPGHNLDARVAVFAVGAGLHRAAERLRGELHAVADAQNRNAEVEQGGVAERGALFEDAVRSARENDAGRHPRAQGVGGRVEADDLRVDVLLADPAGDELGVLRAEIQNGDPFVLHGNSS